MPVHREVYSETVRLLPGNVEAWEARRDLLARARSRIDAAYFIVRNDDVSLAFLGELEQAACAGIQVRLIVDGMFQEITPAAIARLQSAGVSVRQFHLPQMPRVASYTRRLHDKYLAADGQVMIIGSRNVGDAHFGVQVARHGFRDVDVRIEGAVVANADQYFDQLWCSEHVTELAIRDGKKTDRQDAILRCSDICPRMPIADGSQEYLAGYPVCEVLPGQICFAHDPAGSKIDTQGTHVSLDQLVGSAQHSIDIESPYILPVGEFGDLLRDAVRRGVCVRMTTNSRLSTDEASVQAAFVWAIEPFRRSGVEVWEYRGPDTLHAKTCVIDKQVACITSFNFDPRSRSFDTQLAVIIHDSAVAAQLTSVMDMHRRNADPFVHPREQIGEEAGALLEVLELSARGLLTRPFWRHL